MKPRAADWTIVIAGSWNLAILNPQWVATHLFETKDVALEVMIGEGLPRLRMLKGNVSFIPNVDKVILASSSPSDETVQAAEQIARKLLELLPVTPVSAVGINFGYDEDELPPSVLALFELSDAALLAEAELSIKSSTIARSIAREDSMLNYRISIDDNSAAHIHLNFHQDIRAGEQALQAVTGKAVQYKTFGEKLLSEVYSLEMEIEHE